MTRKKQTKKPAAKKAPAKRAQQSAMVIIERVNAEALLNYLMTRPMNEVEPAVYILRMALGPPLEMPNADQPVPGG